LLTLCDLCVAGAVVGCVFTLLECYFVLRFSRKKEPRVAAQPPVTVLKPLHGSEPGLSERLARFCEQDYAGPVQIVFATRDDAAAAAAVVQQLKAEFPGQAIDLVVDAVGHGVNRKVSNLINILPRARYDTLVLSDSDIVVSPDYLRSVTALLTPGVGAVTCLYYGIGEGLWPRLSALAINAHFLPQAILAGRLGLVRHCSGATIALRRSTLDRIGGFAPFANVLADDYAIGAAVRSSGYEIVTAPFLVGHYCFEANLRQLVLHQMRAARTIKSIEPIGYAGTIITHPWPLALLGALSANMTAGLVVAAALACRLTLGLCVARRFGLARRECWLIPLQDIIAFLVYLGSFCGETVHWRGSDYDVTPDGMLTEREAEPGLGMRRS
jgi:ceramide glucosyltransferase